ncbi:response regulator with -like aaa-type and dna-binding domains : Response regulator with CheY-like receiver, AAA-type ATPase, and DNA-binding domains OS=Singulisphaera acidiphila (strain ATCC BAA-1392 / DSM 18658 / VKM B-2454 / MOB10) GN=Sinac_0782 PE=4 SV=1: Response_reg: Sigma54_activat: HTH_8 [Gemmataceae bacterium]|nr:response regulator with -like aaa-type and dna-binding domains : Response regulator with CheY-like receiver, AAA-type ATPase, and DNA-binding domains OS=Singulisphaera acidiphila (strain ATCC BAA-1392 / DSM 18658 / VKM B-2454 / MOB10) GN=Sinac_0782 PE=4 SV=1: Response_reg: Sigma54_activat: HTH_8 [Gemmataceae bacterium]VTU00688.1 response regulator with -like aaa-type and dna-binding domains : Response regulator with CheY-like receiver, AAA-type ATPase, and DNA-binding domains OS=Singulisphaera 
MPKLLIIDDEANVLYSLQTGLETDDLTVVTAKTGKRGLALVPREEPDVVIVDVRLPDMSGLELFERIKEVAPKVPVVIITAFAATDTAIEAMKRGAFDYLLKPVDLHHLREVIGRALELRRMQAVPAVFDRPEAEAEADDAPPGTDPIVGRSPVMQEVYKTVGRIAEQDVTVLILGESGTGKELVARALFQHSKRADRPFLAINCAAIPDALLESELFGHEKGAFTGADRQRVGKFEQADGGTIFLDEIGDMTPQTQAKVLRVLQNQQFERVGGQETLAVDTRVIAATNRNLEAEVAAGRFRQDLFYRLNGVTIALPPLRDRKDDIPLLVDHFIKVANRKLDKHVATIAPDALRVLSGHSWPGNVRELQNVVRYAVIQAVGEVLTVECLPASVRGGSAPVPGGLAADGLDVRKLARDLLAFGSPDIYRQVIAEVDRVVLGEVLKHVANNQVHASELLGISRTTLRAKLAAEKQPPAPARPPESPPGGSGD